jgi:hypothetical protein
MKNAYTQIRAYFTGSLWHKRILFSILGAFGGYVYYYFVGCRSGTCPISSNPYISTIYGAGIGLLVTIGGLKNGQD